MFAAAISKNKFNKSKNYQKITNRIKDNSLVEYIENNSILKILLSAGISRKLNVSDEHVMYLTNELNLLIKYGKNFEESYFLAYDVCNHYNELGFFINIGRGSLTSSMLAYIAGITKIDPILYDLTYHRFVFPGMDKIIFDIDVHDRSIAEKFLIKKYKNNFAYFGTQSFWKVKNAFKDVMEKDQFFGKFAHNDMAFYTKTLSDEFSQPGHTISDIKIKLIKDLTEAGILSSEKWLDAFLMDQKKIAQDINNIRASEFDFSGKKSFEFIIGNNIHLKSLFERYKDAKDEILGLIGTHKSYGVHAVGFVLIEPTEKLAFVSEQNGFKVLDPACSDLDSVLKINILGLTVLEEINQHLKATGTTLNLENIDLSKNEWMLFKNELISGKNEYFQGSIGKFIKIDNFKLESLFDFAKITSYCRPGPLSSYKLSTLNEECPVRFSGILAHTNGWILFQEDVIKIAELVGVDEPALFLKNFAKARALEQYKEKLYPEEFEFLKKYSMLAFNKAHAISYGMYSFLDYSLQK